MDIVAWASVIGGFATALGVMVTLLAILHESKESRFSLNTDLLLKLYEQFNSDQMRIERRNAASALLDIQKNGKAERLKLNSLERVLDFFELLGLLQKRGAIDTDSTKTMFSYWYRIYWQAVSKPLHSSQLSWITTARSGNTLLWQHAQDLEPLLMSKTTTLEAQKLKDSLIDESQLKVGTA